MTLRIDQRPFLATMDVVALVFAVYLVARRPTVRWIVTALIAIGAGAVVGFVLCWLLVDVLDFLGVDLSAITRMWVALGFAGVALVVVNFWHARWWRKAIAVVAVPVVVMTAAVGINADFGAYRTLDDAIGSHAYKAVGVGRVSASQEPSSIPTVAPWTPPANMPKAGRVSSVVIPAPVSHFQARPATIYLPPAALTANPPALPVLITMAGQPGLPSDMFRLGHIDTILNSYAAAHKGLTPIVVEPDQLGSTYANPLCVDGPLGNSATYILTDVVHWIKTHFRVLSEPNAWAVSGFSHGATCAVQFAAGHPDVFPTALAISSELGPTRGADTVQEGFGGSQARASAAQPMALFAAHAPYKDSLIVFAVGAKDSRYLPGAQALRTYAQHAGVATQLIESPGTTHDWYTVRYVFRAAIPMIFLRMGLRQ